MIGTIIGLVLVLALPALWMWGTTKSKFLRTIGSVGLCYFTGIIIALINFNGNLYDKELMETVAYIFVAISLPLILFGFSLKSVKGLAKSVSISFLLICVSVIVVCTATFFIVDLINPEISAYISAMAIGLYTGGTPNLVAIGGALGASTELINFANFSDVIIGGVYFLGLVTFIPKLYKKILGEKKLTSEDEQTDNQNEKEFVEKYTNNDDSLFFLIKNKKLKGLLLTLLLAIGCVGVCFAIYLLLNSFIEGVSMVLVLLIGVSVLGLLFSCVKKVRETKGSYQLGQYFVLMFSISLAMCLDFTKLKDLITTIIVMAIIMLLSILLHILLCKLFKIDGGTALVTSVAGVYGPPFIQPVASALKQDELIPAGIICGVVGLAIGTFIGVAFGSLFLII